MVGFVSCKLTCLRLRRGSGSRISFEDGATLVFYAALFPRLARNTPTSRSLRQRLNKKEITPENYETEESLEKNRISNISTVRGPHPKVGRSLLTPADDIDA